MLLSTGSPILQEIDETGENRNMLFSPKRSGAEPGGTRGVLVPARASEAKHRERMEVTEMSETMRERLLAFCFPNIPISPEQQEAFERAAALQYAWEQERQQALSGLPKGVKSFRLGDFSAELDTDSSTGKLTSKTICPAAYSLLLRSGLLCKALK